MEDHLRKSLILMRIEGYKFTLPEKSNVIKNGNVT